MKIFAQKNGSLTKQELLDISTLLVKGGYTVKRDEVKVGNNYIEFIEFTGDDEKNNF